MLENDDQNKNSVKPDSGARNSFFPRRTSFEKGPAVVEVRRKKISLLEKKKALAGGNSSQSFQKATVYVEGNLSETEVGARVRAVQNAIKHKSADLKEKKLTQDGALIKTSFEEDKERGEQIEESGQPVVEEVKTEDRPLEPQVPVLKKEPVKEPDSAVIEPVLPKEEVPVKKTSTIKSKSVPFKQSAPKILSNPATSYKSKISGNQRSSQATQASPAQPVKQQSSVVLRAANYGPKPVQKPVSKVAPPKIVEPIYEKSSANASQERQSVKTRKFVDEFDSSDRSRKSKRFSEGPRKLTRNVLDRVLEDEDENRVRSEASFKRAQKRKLAAENKEKPAKVIRDVAIPDSIGVGELANRMAVTSGELIKALMKLGMMVSVNQSIDGDTAELVCAEFGHRPKRVQDVLEDILHHVEDQEEDKVLRAPIVTVMGHVDHGKTSLLDALKKTDVASTEFGGITQHIGAYQIVTPYSEAKITFIDTPGHAAFSEMRARGANVTDIVVLVVAADDGVNEQTIEAISHAKAAKVPIIVAINKIDKPSADPVRVKNELLAHDIITEDFGGDVIAVEISAKKNLNLDKLVESILLQAEMLELKANPKGRAEGIVLEATMEKGRGVAVTVLVQRGTLHVGDIVIAGTEFGRVRTMRNSYGKSVKEASISCPVEIFGFNGAPQAGDELFVVEEESQAREITQNRLIQKREKNLTVNPMNSLATMMDRIHEKKQKELFVVLKSDVQGTLEAILHSLNKLSVDGISVKVIHKAIGDVNETDVTLAKASEAVIVGFNVGIMPQAKMMAEREGISLAFHTIVYELLDYVEDLMKGKLVPVSKEHSLGKAELRVVFSKGKTTKIAGCYVQSGLIKRGNTFVKIWRDGKEIFKGKIASMKREKDDVKEAKEGYECGLIMEDFNDLKVGDIIECFEIVKK